MACLCAWWVGEDGARGGGSEHVLKGKIVIVVDDSIVRGTTARQLVGLIYGAGAKEVPASPLPPFASPRSPAPRSLSPSSPRGLL